MLIANSGWLFDVDGSLFVNPFHLTDLVGSMLVILVKRLEQPMRSAKTQVGHYFLNSITGKI
jgi:hypothetical protein